MRKALLGAVAAVALVLVGAGPAAATWSIVAVDEATGEVGVAGAACARDAPDSAAVAPGQGAVVAQGELSKPARDAARDLIVSGAGPAEVIARITDPVFDPSAARRQYAVAVRGQGVAVHTGLDVRREALSAPASGGAASVQADQVELPAVVEQAAAAFERSSGGADRLGDRLLRALEAGSAAGGDRRCANDSDPPTAKSAFVLVARPEDSAEQPAIAIAVGARKNQNPLVELRERYNEARPAVYGDCPGCDLAGLEVPTRTAQRLTAVEIGIGLAAMAAFVVLSRRVRLARSASRRRETD
ncbi:MAG: DUF1028 domain-containing protein [Acidimicrobiales bacterium]